MTPHPAASLEPVVPPAEGIPPAFTLEPLDEPMNTLVGDLRRVASSPSEEFPDAALIVEAALRSSISDALREATRVELKRARCAGGMRETGLSMSGPVRHLKAKAGK